MGEFMDVCKYINTAQQESIIRIITERCRRFKAFEQQFSSLFYDPYTTMRKKHTLTSAVISGFAPNDDGEEIIDGITSTTIYYGRNNKMAQPELRTENAVFHVYSDGASQKTDVVKTRCELYNSDLSKPPIFLLVIFRASKKGELYGIDICLPNTSGEIIERHAIYSQPKVAVLTA